METLNSNLSTARSRPINLPSSHFFFFFSFFFVTGKTLSSRGKLLAAEKYAERHVPENKLNSYLLTQFSAFLQISAIMEWLDKTKLLTQNEINIKSFKPCQEKNNNKNNCEEFGGSAYLMHDFQVFVPSYITSWMTHRCLRFHQLRAIIQRGKKKTASHSLWPSSVDATHLLSIFRKMSLSQTPLYLNIPSVKAPDLQRHVLRYPAGVNAKVSEDVFEVLYAVRLEKHQED